MLGPNISKTAGDGDSVPMEQLTIGNCIWGIEWSDGHVIDDAT